MHALDRSGTPGHAGYSDPRTSLGLSTGVTPTLEPPMKLGRVGSEAYFPVLPLLDEPRKRHVATAEDTEVEHAGWIPTLT